MRTLDAMSRVPRAAAGVAVVAVTFAGAGCGDDEFANRPREPAPMTLSAAITPKDVTVSPAELGAGTVVLIASNLTARSQRLTLTSRRLESDRPPLQQRTGPINPGDTASLTADLVPGTYRVSAGSSSIGGATIRVGPERPSAGLDEP